MADSFPRQYARTQRLTLGEPRTVTVAATGKRVLFLRSLAGSDPVNCLWQFEPATSAEQLLVDPRSVPPLDDGSLPDAERLRRERARESGSGIVSYAADVSASTIVYALDGRLLLTVIDNDDVRTNALDTLPGGFDPRVDPTGTRVAYVHGRTLRVIDSDAPTDRALAGHTGADATDENISWGSADFIAAEEMNRSRGFWWNPAGTALVVTRVDTSPILKWYLADPSDPASPPTQMRYPAAGTDNATVTLHVITLDDAGNIEVAWDHGHFPYLVDASWVEHLTLLVMSRDQRHAVVLVADPATGATTVVRELRDPAWIDVVPGVPAWLGSDRLLTVEVSDDTYRLCVNGEPVTPPGLQVSRVHGVGTDSVHVTGQVHPTEQHVWRVDLPLGATPAVTALTTIAGVHDATVGGCIAVVRSATIEHGSHHDVLDTTSGAVIATLVTVAEKPIVTPRVALHRIGIRELAAAVLWPHGEVPDHPVPVVMDPYGGPHAQRVLASRNAFCSSQWFADQGFAVVVADGRGTPGRGAAWDRSVLGDLASPALDDQVDALFGLAAIHPQLDLSRVGIKGWSFGGYLAALAVLRRPDVFHAAIAGAPVTEWRLYDTFYTERYLGDPKTDPEHYERSSLLPLAKDLQRPLMLIHGFADDNVVVAHTLQLSGRLLAHGRPHEVLPLVGVTHMASQEDVAENLLLLQVDFLRRSLGLQ